MEEITIAEEDKYKPQLTIGYDDVLIKPEDNEFVIFISSVEYLECYPAFTDVRGNPFVQCVNYVNEIRLSLDDNLTKEDIIQEIANVLLENYEESTKSQIVFLKRINNISNEVPDYKGSEEIAEEVVAGVAKAIVTNNKIMKEYKKYLAEKNK